MIYNVNTASKYMKPIITIVTPSYNQGQYIERTIQSILVQEGDFYIDYIIQDGGSKDGTLRIINKYQNLLKENCDQVKIKNLTYFVSKHDKFKYNKCLGISYRWSSKKDDGQVDALLKGFDKSQGNIFNWLNSDDVFFNERVFETIITLFNKNSKLDLITADGNLIDKNDKIIGQMIIPKINLNELIYLDYHVLQPSTFITRYLYQNNKKYLDKNMKCAFDALFYTHIFKSKTQYVKLKKILSCYRFYPEIKTLSLSDTRYKEQMKITLSVSLNPFLILLSGIYRYLEIVLKPKIQNRYFQSFFNFFKKFSYLVVTGQSDRIYE